MCQLLTIYLCCWWTGCWFLSWMLILDIYINKVQTEELFHFQLIKCTENVRLLLIIVLLFVMKLKLTEKTSDEDGSDSPRNFPGPQSTLFKCFPETHWAFWLSQMSMSDLSFTHRVQKAPFICIRWCILQTVAEVCRDGLHISKTHFWILTISCSPVHSSHFCVEPRIK